MIVWPSLVTTWKNRLPARIVAFGSSIKHITPDDASWTRAHVTSERTIGGFTALVEDGEDHLYAINGQSVRFALRLSPSPFQIFQLD